MGDISLTTNGGLVLDMKGTLRKSCMDHKQSYAAHITISYDKKRLHKFSACQVY